MAHFNINQNAYIECQVTEAGVLEADTYKGYERDFRPVPKQLAELVGKVSPEDIIELDIEYNCHGWICAQTRWEPEDVEDERTIESITVSINGVDVKVLKEADIQQEVLDFFEDTVYDKELEFDD